MPLLAETLILVALAYLLGLGLGLAALRPAAEDGFLEAAADDRPRPVQLVLLAVALRSASSPAGGCSPAAAAPNAPRTPAA